MVADIEVRRFDASRATLGDLLDRWLEQITPTRSPKTVAEYRRKIEGRIRPALGDIRLSKLGADTLDAWYGKWQVSGLSDSTVHHLHSILSAALTQAEKWGWIYSSPARRASPPAQRSPVFVIPSPEQLIELVRTAHEIDPVLGTAVALAALTGARRGELCALRWSDVDLERGTIRITRSLGIVEGVIHEGPTKPHANRDVALDDLGIEVLRDRWAYMQDLSRRAESPLAPIVHVSTISSGLQRRSTPRGRWNRAVPA